jgi:putative (di)nucleoside polyphosphate hydrolase
MAAAVVKRWVGGRGATVGAVSGQHFRAGVVIVVRHPDRRRVLAFERVDEAGSWQLPQGGLQLGEEPIATAWRELMEETGLGEHDVVARVEYPEWVAYEWPADVIRESGHDGKRRGQVQKWFFFDALRDDIIPTPDGSEFVDWRWVDPAWLVATVVEWRRRAYDRVLGSL